MITTLAASLCFLNSALPAQTTNKDVIPVESVTKLRFEDPSLSVKKRGWPLLDDASKRAFRYFIERSHPVTGFTKDRSTNFTENDFDGHHVASIAAIGFALSAYGIGAERGWMPRDEAIKLSKKTMKFMLEKAPKHEGWYYHWLNWETGAREWKSEVSTIDSAILWCGAILAEQALKDKELTAMVEKMLGEVNWNFMLTNGGTKPNKKTFTMGWHPETQFIEAEWSSYFESAMIYLLMLGEDPQSPVDSWTAFERKRVYAHGREVITGGPLFMHQMSQIFFDFKNRRDGLGIDYWANSREMTLIQREYSVRNPKGFKGYNQNIWGLSACDIPDGYGAQGYPDGPDNGTLAAPAAVASMMFTPKESLAAAEAFVQEYPAMYGRYGYAGGINPTKGWIAPDVIGIDLGQMFLGIENARDGLPNRLFMKSKLVQKGMERAGLKVTNEGPAENRPIFLK